MIQASHVPFISSLGVIRPIWRLGIIFACLFVATLSRTSLNPAFRYFRLAIAAPALLASLSIISAPAPDWSNNQGSIKPSVQLRVASCFAALRVLEICIVSFWDSPSDMPRWVMQKKVYEGNRFTGVGFIDMPIPRGMKGRIIYTLDLLLTVRGSSWLHGRVWNWAPPKIKNYESTSSRIIFVFQLIRTLLWQYVWLDIATTVIKTHDWTAPSPHPLTSLPLIQQIIYTAAIATSTVISISATYYSLALFFVLFFASHPYSWPPLYSSLLSSDSLVDFWTNRWHTAYRYQFLRITSPVNMLFSRHQTSSSSIPQHLISFLGGLFHTLLILPPSSPGGNISSARTSVMKFLLAQPVGMLLERTFDSAFTSGTQRRAIAQRIFVWSWLIWTGRWYGDGWCILASVDGQGINGSRVGLVQHVSGVM